MIPIVLRSLMLPAWQRLTHQNSLRLLPYLDKTQWLPLDDIVDLQWRRVSALLKHAYEYVPYYRELMDESGTEPVMLARQRSLEMLPLLDRSTITHQLNRLRATNMPAHRFVPNGTGGSTGEPLRFFDDREMAGWCDAADWRSHRWFGVDVGERYSYLWGSNFDLSKFQGFAGRIRSRALNLLMLPAWQLSEKTSLLFWKQLAEFKPRLLIAYAGAIYQWANLLGKDLEPIPGLSAIIVSAETLYEEWRGVIEDCFKVPVYNRYGGRDIKFIAQECSRRKGLHINSENVFVEIIKDGRPVSAGELGEIVITRLDNLAMPFIRYRSGDLGVMANHGCDCGRSLPLLEKIEGRVQDAIVTEDGAVISGPFFAHVMKDCPDVQEFQVHQLAMDRLLVIIVLHRERVFLSRSRIERLVRQHIGSKIEIEFDLRDSIPLTGSGKRRIIVSHLQNRHDSRQPASAPVV